LTLGSEQGGGGDVVMKDTSPIASVRVKLAGYFQIITAGGENAVNSVGCAAVALLDFLARAFKF